ncbi:hypothetical protein DNHGIG_38860 [Collibacillus ludicampi]|jgi:disulfide bond formation protein DsbB|uniref:DUF2273 domain-containing protein n=1 Tax=Collibacillus ludicampi TaxID=2771369 RepID=A0AAV4LKF7_9BACL|nr:hypothetical protein [Collibacillus ludicampi]GIM48337.1 hypothetical protein DNHGIG_38860 [Collibacillus ludicampi]
MRRETRYFFFTLIFVLIIAGLVSQNYTFLGITFLLGILIGGIVDTYDNRRDEKHKHVNRNFNYHH